MKIRLIRHATLQIEYNGLEILVDPMFAPRHAFGSLTIGPSASRNPMNDLPCAISELDHPDLTILTHTHFDHFDKEAALSNIRHSPAICQPADAPLLEACNFENIIPMANESVSFRGITFYRTIATHGHSILSKVMGKGSGYVLKSTNDPCVYITGDTIWNRQVAATIEQHKPQVILANCGAARFNIGAPITMTAGDLLQIRAVSPGSLIIAVHMESINHCRLGRNRLMKELENAGMSHDVVAPADGQELPWSSGDA